MGGHRVSPARAALRETALSLFSLSLPLSDRQCIRPYVRARPRLGNSGGILFNIYIYIYMSNGDRPSASLVKGRAREKERERERESERERERARDIRDEGHPETHRRAEGLSLPLVSHVELPSCISRNHADRSKERPLTLCVCIGMLAAAS